MSALMRAGVGNRDWGIAGAAAVVPPGLCRSALARDGRWRESLIRQAMMDVLPANFVDRIDVVKCASNRCWI
ncbi:hypothetical protein, partial [Xanthomonas sp. WHRI 8370]|uniref:hypothetical protein n=1 Tax=Xanthomonas sp. WHRI 8370 TaxID=3161572 RepID=UPI0032E88D65